MREMTRIEKRYYYKTVEYGIDCWCANDGCLIIFDRTTIDKQLQLFEYDSKEKAYWFNSSHDRYIAESYDTNLVSVNPSFLKYLQ